jgi:predicted PurR-regulated permease PerM
MTRVSDWTQWVSTYGLALIIVIVIFILIVRYIPRFVDSYFENKKQQESNTKALITALNNSNNVIGHNSDVITKNSEINVQYQTLLSKYSESVISFTETTADLAQQVEKGNDMNQKVYIAVLHMQDNIDDVKNKINQ